MLPFLMAQGTICSYDPASGGGLILDDFGDEIPLAKDALDGSIFRMLRQGQRVNYDRVEVDGRAVATHLHLGQAND